MVRTIGYAKERHHRYTRGGGNFYQATECAEKRRGTESDPNHICAWKTKPVAAPYSLPVKESHPLKGNNTSSTQIYRSDRGIPERGGRSFHKSKRAMVCVYTPHWGGNGTKSTDGGKSKRVPYHQ